MAKDTFFEQAAKLPPVSEEAAAAYLRRQDALRKSVDEMMTDDPETLVHVRHKAIELMYANHANHVRFMANVFRYNNYPLLARVAVWVYRAYHAHGFSYGYFPLALRAWQRAVDVHLSPGQAREINGVYEWLLANHASFVTLAEEAGYETFPAGELPETAKTFVDLLLLGDFHSCVGLARHLVNTGDDLAAFYSGVLGPSLYEIGRRWEGGTITVAHEHMAVAIVTRVMAACYLDLAAQRCHQGGIVITAAPNEFHEVGARMVADLLELKGWDVDYTGANTPVTELLRLLQEKRPLIVGISAVMTFNLAEVEAVVSAIKTDPALRDIRIMVGGLAFVHSPGLWKSIGADGYAGGIADALELAARWREEMAGS